MSKQIVIDVRPTQSIRVLGIREQYRDEYWQKRDPIYNDRLLWRAQTFRHMVHLLPNQTILELGCGQGLFTRQLLHVSRGENPITSVTFNSKIQTISLSLVKVGIGSMMMIMLLHLNL